MPTVIIYLDTALTWRISYRATKRGHVMQCHQDGDRKSVGGKDANIEYAADSSCMCMMVAEYRSEGTYRIANMSFKSKYSDASIALARVLVLRNTSA